MTVADFAAFYRCVHGYAPFPWQERLLERVVNEGWPETIALPTSSGKTSAIDIAVFHLALQAGKSALERQAKLRMFFVIDRCVVVDEAAEHAMNLATKLFKGEAGIVDQVATALQSFGGRVPLDVAVLRGGMYRDNTWADEPNQPLVCVSTVDQVGSRLLFRGYQVSDSAKPVHAALVGSDSLIIVDEAHLSAEFLDTLAVVENRPAGDVEVSRGVRVVRMSATMGGAKVLFELGAEDYSNEVLGPRLTASKPTELRTPEKGFEDELVKAARELAERPGVEVTGVVVNTVAVARAVFETLRKLKDGSEAVLLTGRNRPLCARQLWDKYRERIAAKKNRPVSGRLFVVATQTVEVGANIDFEALVSESAPLDALRQRFGRLNRLGREVEARAILVRRPKEDPVYGEATGKTWEWLGALAKVDFGVVAMDKAVNGIDKDQLGKRVEPGPLVFPKYLELWTQTNPIPEPDPDVAPFLHGKNALEDADIQLVWRVDVQEGETAEEWQKTVELMAPLLLESLAVPLGALRRWLRGESKFHVSDVEGAAGMEEDDNRKEAKPVLIWGRTKGDRLLTSVDQIRPGDVVVIPTSYGGCDEFGWHPGSNLPVSDIAHLAIQQMAEAGMRSLRLRLTVLITEKQDGALQTALTNFLGYKESSEEEEPKDALLEELQKFYGGEPRINSSLKMASWPKQRRKQVGGIEALMKPEDQDDDSAGLEKLITLEEHVAGVVQLTRRYAEGCGLAPALVDDLVLAAELHDLGKWDVRFQTWLGYCLPKDSMKGPLAKSGGGLSPLELRSAREKAGYPKGARHESASVLLAEKSGELGRAHDAELVMHLIGTHHGFGRPLLPFWDEDEDETVTAEYAGKRLETGTGRQLARFDAGWADTFTHLNQRYGYWGLAYLEAILRRADCVQSREEQEEG